MGFRIQEVLIDLNSGHSTHIYIYIYIYTRSSGSRFARPSLLLGFVGQKKLSRGSGSALKSFLDALRSICTKYQPKRSHGDPFQLNVDYFLNLLTAFDCENRFLNGPRMAPGAKVLSQK